MLLTEQEREFLKDLAKHREGRPLKYPTHPFVKSLADRGYVQLVQALTGPLGLPSGAEWVTLTEAGRIAMESIQ